MKEEWVKVVALIRNNVTGEIRSSDTKIWYEDDGKTLNDYIWSMGNFSCDCNRALFWSMAGGEEELDVECGDDKFDVNLIIPSTGEIVYEEYKNKEV